MPANLPPNYYEIERRFRVAASDAERIECLEEMLSVIPKHKGTDHVRGDLRKKLSRLKASSQSRKGTSRFSSAYNIPREGAGQAVLVGWANSGKSSLVRAFTNAEPEVSPAPFTTWGPTPGMMEFENVQIQLVDTPPFNQEYVDPGCLDLIRRCDVVLLVVDVTDSPVKELEETAAFLAQNNILPLGKAGDFEDQKYYCKPFLVLVNKVDTPTMMELYELFLALLEQEWHTIPVSARTGWNLETFQQTLFDMLEVIRVYSKAPWKEPDKSQPFLLPCGSTVEEFAGKVHNDFVQKLKSARVWGSSDFDGQLVGRDYVLSDGDVVELRI
ncbi:MAG: 50S ribosome-binding GTPase [Anaerolineales bacterium]|nr:50S ribosome-binding GTPase [Anaerolineales bacterium]